MSSLSEEHTAIAKASMNNPHKASLLEQYQALAKKADSTDTDCGVPCFAKATGFALACQSIHTTAEKSNMIHLNCEDVKKLRREVWLVVDEAKKDGVL